MSELIDDLWGDSPPDSAGHTVETYVSRLRRVLHIEGQLSILVKLHDDQQRADALDF